MLITLAYCMQEKPALPTHTLHCIDGSLMDSITEIQMHQDFLDSAHCKMLREVLQAQEPKRPDEPSASEFTIDEVSRQYGMFLKLQRQVMTEQGRLMETASVRDIASMISTMSSVITLFLRARKEVDTLKEEAALKAAVLAAVGELPLPVQERFFSVLNSQG